MAERDKFVSFRTARLNREIDSFRNFQPYFWKVFVSGCWRATHWKKRGPESWPKYIKAKHAERLKRLRRVRHAAFPQAAAP